MKVVVPAFSKIVVLGHGLRGLFGSEMGAEQKEA